MDIEHAIKLHQNGKILEAKQKYLQILEKNTNCCDALHLLGVIAYQEQNFVLAKKYIAKSIKINPSNPEYYNNYGNVLYASEKFIQAEKHYQQACKLNSNYIDAHYNLGNTKLKLNKIKEAIEHLEHASILTNKKNKNIQNNLGNAYYVNNKFKQAEKVFADLVKLFPNNIENYSNLANALYKLGKFDNIINLHPITLNLDPENISILNIIALAYKNVGQYTEAISILKKTLEIKNNDVQALNNLAKIYAEQGDLESAINLYKLAIKNYPSHSCSYINLGAIYFLSNKCNTALKYLDQAIVYNPKLATAYLNRSLCFLSLDKPDLAKKNIDTAIKLAPRNWELDCLAINILLRIYECLGDWQKISKYTHKLIDTAKKNWALNIPSRIEPFSIAALSCTLEFHNQIAREKSQQLELIHNKPSNKLKTKINKEQQDILNIGYISPDFKNHSVGLWLRDMFSFHDPNKFKVFGYSLVSTPDEMTEKFKNNCDQFTDLSNMSIINAAKNIVQDKIHILIDLAGYTGNSPMPILSNQPAPIQCSLFGYSTSLQANFIQYMFSHKTLVPDNMRKYFQEKLIYMPETLAATQPFEIPDLSIYKISRKDFNLPESTFVFCCITRSYRINYELVSCWMKILESCPNSILWIYADNNKLKSNYKLAAKKHGININRIYFSNSLILTEHWQHRLADLWLDSHSVSSGTATMLSLWAGLPVLTLAGTTPQARTSAALLKTSKIPELITYSQQEYISKAIEIYNNKNLNNNLKNKILKNRNNNPVFNNKLYVQYLEAAYGKIWDLYINNKPPQDILLKPISTMPAKSSE